MLESTYLWGVFRSGGDRPDILSAMRRLTAGPTWPPRLLLQSNCEAPGIRRHRTEQTSARSVDVIGADTAGAMQRHAAQGSDTESFDLAIHANSVRWSEGAILDVAGSEVTPGLEWTLPAAADHDGMHYTSRMFRVAGHVAGHRVKGFVGCDEVYLAQGRQNYIDDPLTAAHLSQAWCAWATEYDDGTVESGNLAFGRSGFGFGVRADGSVVHVATTVSGSVERNDLGCPQHISFDVDGEPWEFVADQRGCPIEPLPGPVRQAEGWFRRVGETRRPVVWCASPEVPVEVRAP
jgi:hypothetical protein